MSPVGQHVWYTYTHSASPYSIDRKNLLSRSVILSCRITSNSYTTIVRVASNFSQHKASWIHTFTSQIVQVSAIRSQSRNQIPESVAKLPEACARRQCQYQYKKQSERLNENETRRGRYSRSENNGNKPFVQACIYGLASSQKRSYILTPSRGLFAVKNNGNKPLIQACTYGLASS